MKLAIQELEQLLLSLRSGGIDPLKAVAKGEGGLYRILREAMDQGQPLLGGIEEFWNQALSARMELSQRKRLKTLIVLRTVGVLTVVSFVRLGLLWTGSGLDSARFWGGDFQGALLLGFWGVAGMMISMPRHWLWRQHWTPLGFQWLQSYLGVREEPMQPAGEVSGEPFPWFQSFRDCSIKEITWGVSLVHEKHRILRDFAMKQREGFQARLTFIEESLPMWELFVLGPLMVLGLALPSVGWLVSG